MKTDIQELKMTARGRALEKARQTVEQSTPDNGPVLDEAFAEFTPAPHRKNAQHTPRPEPAPGAVWDAQEASKQIAAQLEQLENQRRQLTRLLESLDMAE